MVFSKIKKINKIIVVLMVLLIPLRFAVAAPTPPQAPVAPAAPSVPANPPDAPIAPGEDPEVTNLPPTQNQPVATNESSEIVNNVVESSSSINENTNSNDVLASEVSNSETGANSENNTQNMQDATIAIENNNDANLDNTISGGASSGDNNANYNTGNGDVKTGDSNFVLNVLNLINTNFIALPGGVTVFIFKNILGNLVGNYIIDPLSNEAYDLNGSRIEVGNSDTGASSENNSSLSAANILGISNDNQSEINNNFDLTSNTGNNQSSYNTGNGTINTGDANISVALINFLNSNFIVTNSGIIGVINVFGNWLGNLVLPEQFNNGNVAIGGITVSNQNTGANSDNNATYQSDNFLDINNDNEADLQNNINVNSTSGGNNALGNTGNGNIESGTSNTSVNLKNEGNKNIFGDLIVYLSVNVFGVWNGSILLPGLISALQETSDNNPENTIVENRNTGASSENNSTLDQKKGLEIANDNNADIENNINITANSGGNSSSYNTGNGIISTGNTNAALNILNFFNMNIVAGNALYLIVNVFGDWTGNIGTQNIISETDTTTTDESSTIHTIITIGDQTYRVVNEVTTSGKNFVVKITEDINKDKSPAVLSASTTDGSNSGTTTGGNPEGFLSKNLGTIFLGLFIIYAAVLLALAKRKRNKVFTVRRLV